MTKNILDRITLVCLISGVISGLITTALIWFIIPSAWFFFIIPAVMGWSIDRYVTIPKELLEDGQNIERLQKKAGLTCGGLVLFFVILVNIPFFLVLEPIMYLKNIIFYAAAGVSVYWGYTRGVRCITDAYYDEEEDPSEDGV